MARLGAEHRPVLVPVHALECTGVNAIPLALAEEVARQLGWQVSLGVVQTNLVGHTGASGFARLARQAVFAGDVEPDRDYVLVDDFIGQGGSWRTCAAICSSKARGSSAPPCSPASYIP